MLDTEQNENEAACGGSALTAELGADTPRVGALIARVMADYPGITAHAQAKYYEEVHQHLAPLARELERENARLRSIVERASRLEVLYSNTNLNPEGFRLAIEGIARDANMQLSMNA